MAYEDNESVEGRFNALMKPIWSSSRQPVASREAIQAAERARSGNKIFFSFQHSLCRVTLSFKGKPDMICR
ncbi:hypothetical protein DPMN_079701 [Dreissena polymorpha]|uniref:Uncharacterized protein n=1 Tax=Dreissena polymorpha TaxID=45954 RepID=A0A9D4BT75_DREPO|nr:hypothetical protein DPMN_079701 [Dreissena polymorpha]